MELISDLPTGPLDAYRKQASFDWKKMKLYFYSKEEIKLMNEAYNFLKNEPLFHIRDDDLSLQEKRYLTYLKMKKIYASKVFYPDNYYSNIMKGSILGLVLGSYDWSLSARRGLLREFAISGIYGLGTERHFKYISALMELEIGFAFCLTEISHGTDTKALRTEAKYDPDTKSFIIHTPDFEAAKCWAGCLGKTASHCLVFAQLFTPDGICHGLHCFIVPVRDPQTMDTYPGVTIIDMGPKLGLNGMDNGIVMFNHYSVPKENLLNKTGDVTDEGNYVSSYKDPRKRHGASLGNLSSGRIAITGFGVVNLTKALTIAIRYSAVRKQFGTVPNCELPIIEYPLQQWRLFPFLGGLYALHNFSRRLRQHQMRFQQLSMEGNQETLLNNFGQELHALSCVGKAYSGWLARDAIQECREACGGHGYLRAAGFGSLRDDNDANCTYEGDNNVLLQQTSNWLVALWRRRSGEEEPAAHPMGSTAFLHRRDAILRSRLKASAFAQHVNDGEVVLRCLETFEWLVCWLLKETVQDLDRLSKLNDAFTAKNHCQIFRAHNLSIAFFELTLMSWFLDWWSGAESEIRSALARLGALFALKAIMRHSSTLQQGNFFVDDAMQEAQEQAKRLLQEILPDSVALVDAIAPPDFVLNSALGNSDGRVYDHLHKAMVTAEGATTKDKYWIDMRYKTAKL